MIPFLVFVIAYFVFLIIIGLYAHKKTKKTPQDYFLANRTFGPILLFFTLAATNFSAFTFLGFAGNAYTSGFGQYGIMAFGTAFMAIMFYVIGRKVWQLGKEKGYITPPELIGARFNSTSLRLLFMSVMVVFTIPYLATQAIGAGLLIESVTGVVGVWQIGAVVTMLVIMIYVLVGGMRGSGWTDVVQGVLMIVALSLAVVFVAINLGGFEQANLLAYEANPALFARPGGNDYFLPQIWFSFMILWLFADPMFPQIFSRFYTAKNQRSLKQSMILYPVVVSFLFLFPVLIGVWAHGAGIVVTQADMVLPLMVARYAPPLVYSFVMVGALAALMSTADSQLLSLSTMLSRDLIRKKKWSDIAVGKVMVVVLSLFAIWFVIGQYDTKQGIMGTLVATTFSGLAVLFPTALAALYWKKATKWGCIASILIGEATIFVFQFTDLPTFGFLSALWAIAIAVAVLILTSYITMPKHQSN
ncbi:MAG: sodium:solute symporter family protein [Candidatus Thermoplasmatota archaeon]|nr:sodium:solute symporter family protein [Candidatus Thermoplasmatota archaeon]